VDIVILSLMVLGGSQEGDDTYFPWEANAGAAEEEELSLRDLTLRDNEVEEHHVLVWKRDGVLAEPTKRAPTKGSLFPEKA
jgi:hypothetical protein